jgi:hypothetical protein
MMAVPYKIAVIRGLRLASHELENVCRTSVGGVAMAISQPRVGTLAEDPHEVEPDAMRDDEGGEHGGH